MNRATWMVPAAIVVAVVAAHGGALQGAFHYDDGPSITRNPALRSFDPVRYFSSSDAASAESGVAGYRPVTVTSFALNYAVGELEPRGYLVVNLLLFGLVAWMVFVLGRVLLQHDGWAAFAALAYALHPLNAEGVNYVVARSSLLVTLFGLMAVWAFLRRRSGGTPWWTAAGMAAFVLALLSKESGAGVIVVLAATIVLEPVTFSRPVTRRPSSALGELWRALWPYAVAMGAYAAVWWIVAGVRLESQGQHAAFPLLAMAELVWRSLWLWVWPSPLVLDHALVFTGRFDMAVAAWVFGGLVTLAVVVWQARHRQPLVSWCLVWAVAGLAPLATLPWTTVKGLLQENRMAFSAVGLAWLTAVAVRAVYLASQTSAASGGSVVRPRVVRGASLVAIALVAAAAVLTDRGRSAVWADDVRLWEEVVAHDPTRRAAYVNLGSAYIKRGDRERGQAALSRAVALAPDDAFSSFLLGSLAYENGRYEEADRLLQTVAAAVPTDVRTQRLLGLVAIQRGRDGDAKGYFERAVMLDPRDGESLAQLGLLAQRSGDDALAEQWYRAAVDVDATHTMARNNLGTLYLVQQRLDDALEQFSAVVDRNPDDFNAALNRAVTLNAMGRRTEARVSAAALLARLPNDPRYDRHRRNASVLLERIAP